jgi:mRNA-degrading endonuclease RelE of RelBE toxin-antitoxin system
MCVYEVEIVPTALEELAALRAFDARSILDAVEGQLKHTPNSESTHRKELTGIQPPFEAVPPIWQLSVGEFRVFYDVDDIGRKVIVRAVRRKPPHKTTKEIL